MLSAMTSRQKGVVLGKITADMGLGIRGPLTARMGTRGRDHAGGACIHGKVKAHVETEQQTQPTKGHIRRAWQRKTPDDVRSGPGVREFAGRAFATAKTQRPPQSNA